MIENMNSLSKHFVIIDTETGGVDPLTHSILSIGLVSWDGQHREEIFILEPHLSTNSRSMEVNQIDLDQLKQVGCTPLEACDRLEAFVSRLSGVDPIIFAGHNISFDLAFIRRLYQVAQRPLPTAFSHRSVDTHSLLWALATLGDIPPSACSSDGAFTYFNVAPPEHLRHTALGDALATRELLLAILNLLDDR